MVSGGILVSDFDGTMTRRDFFHLALETLPESAALWWRRYEQGEMSHFDALATIFAELRCDEAQARGLIARMEPDPALRGACEELSRAGWRVLVVSAGCAWYIEKILGQAGLDLEVHSNPGNFHPGAGLRMERPESSPFFDRETGIDKAAVVRRALEETSCVAFAGDGRPDLAPALLVAPERRFAKGWLADELTRRNEAFIPFSRWSEIGERLLGGAP